MHEFPKKLIFRLKNACCKKCSLKYIFIFYVSLLNIRNTRNDIKKILRVFRCFFYAKVRSRFKKLKKVEIIFDSERVFCLLFLSMIFCKSIYFSTKIYVSNVARLNVSCYRSYILKCFYFIILFIIKAFANNTLCIFTNMKFWGVGSTIIKKIKMYF